MRKMFAVMLLLCLLLSCTSLADGAVMDDAVRLSAVTVEGLTTLNERLADAGLHFTLMTKHFTGGKNVRLLCSELAGSLQLGSNDVFLLLIIGEDSYAFWIGDDAKRVISEDQLQTILASRLDSDFKARQYDRAVQNTAIALAGQVQQSTQITITTSDLFGTGTQTAAQPSGSTDPFSGNWWQGFFTTETNTQSWTDQRYDYADYYGDDSEQSGIGFGTVCIFLLFVFLFARRKNSMGSARGKAPRTMNRTNDPFRKSR